MSTVVDFSFLGVNIRIIKGTVTLIRPLDTSVTLPSSGNPRLIYHIYEMTVILPRIRPTQKHFLFHGQGGSE